MILFVCHNFSFNFIFVSDKSSIAAPNYFIWINHFCISVLDFRIKNSYFNLCGKGTKERIAGRYAYLIPSYAPGFLTSELWIFEAMTRYPTKYMVTWKQYIKHEPFSLKSGTKNSRQTNLCQKIWKTNSNLDNNGKIHSHCSWNRELFFKNLPLP